MTIQDRLAILERLYEVYGTFSAGLRVACVQGCAACCTQNVTMTTLEGYRIIQRMIATEQTDLLQRLHQSPSVTRFQPAISTNELAALCIEGKDPPEEETDAAPAPCPFLSNDACLIYADRPFGCRCFLSARRCEVNTFAVIDPLVITVNTLFLQFVEHADAGGFFGNLTDILLCLESETGRKAYETRGNGLNPAALPINRPIPAVMVPPKHRQKIEPILAELRRIVGFGAGGRGHGAHLR
jgi:Fe-S-cluster containining protein